PRLIEAIQPVRQYVLAACVYHFFESGLFDELAPPEGVDLDALAKSRSRDRTKLRAFLDYLKNEGLVAESEGRWALSAKGRDLADFRGWYTMLIGGYGHTFLQLGEKLTQGSGWATRDTARVGAGSCQISHFDAIPLARSLMAKAPAKGRRLLDL